MVQHMLLLSTNGHIDFILRHQLEELLKQRMIVPVDEIEELPIISPFVLESKWRNASMTSGSREALLFMYRLCCDFRYLNTQSRDFNCAIPDLQGLTQSFSHKKKKQTNTFHQSFRSQQFGLLSNEDSS